MKKKLNLNDLKVKSFITGFDREGVQTVKGGRPPKSHNCAPVEPEPHDWGSDISRCNTDFFWC